MKSLLALPDGYIRPEWRTCPIPGRPWWQARPGKSLLRRDGVFAHVHGWPNDPWTVDKCVAYDLEAPLLRPDFHLGQAWLWQFEDGEVLECLVQTHENVAALNRGCAPGGHFLRALTGFLLHDPYRPDLAPWSGSC